MRECSKNFASLGVLIGMIIVGVSTEEIEPTPQDGWYNNLVHPDWGAIDTQLLRKAVPPAYSDGVYHLAGPNRPNPFLVSEAAHSSEPYETGQGSARGRNALLVYFGQQVVEELLDVQRPGCPREFENIPVPSNLKRINLFDPDGKGNIHMPFLRSRYDQRTGISPNNPRQQINEITPYIDGGLFYGPAKTWTDAIREYSEVKKGRLKADDINKPISSSYPAYNNIKLPFANPPPPRDHYLKPVSRFYRIGNPRGFENPFILTFGVLFFRWHNYMADKISSEHPELNDEEVFERTKKFVVAHHQKMVMYDWLPMWLQRDENGNIFQIPPYNKTDCGEGDYCPFDGYNLEIHPGIAQEFQTAAMRFGHTLVTPGIWIRGPLKGNRNTSSEEDCNWKSIQINVPGSSIENTHGIRLCNAYWNGQETVGVDMDSIIRGMASTLSEREDHILVPDLRERVFGPLDFSRRDLAVLNIQRARDHGIPDYNTVRKAYGLQAVTWDEINSDPDMRNGPIERLRLLHNTSMPDNVDLFAGGMLETTLNGPGPLFRAIVLDQFMRIRHGDRFWFENTDERFRSFTDTEIEEIRNVTLRDIILAVTNVTDEELPANVFVWNSSIPDPCQQPFQLNTSETQMYNGLVVLENCTDVKYYDYFSGSELSFVLTFVLLGLCVPATFIIMVLMSKVRQAKIHAARRVQVNATVNIAKFAVKWKNAHIRTIQVHPVEETVPEQDSYKASEWVGPKTGERRIKILFNKSKKMVVVEDMLGRQQRMIDLRNTDKIYIKIAKGKHQNLLSIHVQDEIDLVLRFIDTQERDEFVNQAESFFENMGVDREKQFFPEKKILNAAETKEQRQELLDKFFRVSCMQTFEKSLKDVGLDRLDSKTEQKIQRMQLTRAEFADAFGLKPNSVFVKNMFLLGDKDNNGFISFKEFQDLFAVLAAGKAEDKARMLFNMYDIRQRGHLLQKEFTDMIKSLLDLANTSLKESELKDLISAMYKIAGLKENANMNFEAFKKIFASEEYDKALGTASLGINGLDGVKSAKSSGNTFMERSKTFIQSYEDKDKDVKRPKSKIAVRTTTDEYPKGRFRQKLYEFSRYVEEHMLVIFWGSLYIFITIGIFVERAYYYTYEREHVGLRRIAGLGVTVTRGAASVMMWTYSSLLVTMCRNTITFLRETFLHRFIPFDAAHDFHLFIAAIALLATVTHCIGHGVNLYHISTQASSDLNCFFREYSRDSDVLAYFHYWAFQTLTGITGIILTLIVIVIYVFALPYSRRHLFRAFWVTHKLYIVLYIFLILHGAARFVQEPLFANFFLGPCILFLLDKLLSYSRRKIEVTVVKAEILPSDVTALTMKRPPDFDYKSGQWVRIACETLGKAEYHPFTLSSAPHEEKLSVHIRALGPWTTNLRHIYDPNNLDGKSPPKVFIDGPFGEGHQDWYRFPVSVLVGGGIGVTPFASILKDIANRTSYASRFTCQKVYFLWITRTQKQFEWFTDIIRQVETADKKNFVISHIFITQFKQKFDLRTTMLWICERHFHKIAGKSLFTGLRSTTHFGRPRLEDFLMSLKYEHPEAKQIGVFSCGPSTMTISVTNACSVVNKYDGFPQYVHHFENF